MRVCHGAWGAVYSTGVSRGRACRSAYGVRHRVDVLERGCAGSAEEDEARALPGEQRDQ